MTLPIALLFLLLTGSGFAQDRVAFAFANQKGNALLTIAPQGAPLTGTDVALFDSAICDNGVRYPLVFLKAQPSQPGDDGRALAHNFERYAGYRFRVARGRIPADASCLLGPRHFFEERTPLPMERWASPADAAGNQPPDCAAALRATLPHPEDRAALGCAELAKIGDRRLLAVEYERRGDHMLGAVVLALPGRALLVKYPASASSTSAWRVDDDGKWQPHGFVPLFAFENTRTGALEVAVQWGGAEGGNLLLYRAGGDLLEALDLGYRYWAPR